jgi:hypothetical protein
VGFAMTVGPTMYSKFLDIRPEGDTTGLCIARSTFYLAVVTRSATAPHGVADPVIIHLSPDRETWHLLLILPAS